MPDQPKYDPKDKAEVTRVSKRGDWYTVEGYASGKKVSIDVPAPSIDGASRREAEALMRRSLYGESQRPPERRA